tara:strand:- start:9 stop:215 length:207 start_codon:yes stop_codon:yes gene_type:complete
MVAKVVLVVQVDRAVAVAGMESVAQEQLDKVMQEVLLLLLALTMVQAVAVAQAQSEVTVLALRLVMEV